jgi:hypothetical protein
MDRNLGMPKKSQENMMQCAGFTHVPSGLSMKQIRRRMPGVRLKERPRPKRTTKTARSTRSFTSEH